MGAGGFSCSEWPTPIANDHKSLYAGEETLEKNARPLREVVDQWSTPRASDGEKGGPNQAFGAGGVPLVAQAAQWATPSVAIATGGQVSRGQDRQDELLLAGQAMAVTTARCSPQAPATSTDGGDCSPSGLTLNPRFVEALMGWPTGWTDFECSGTALSRFRRRMRCAFLQLGSPPEAPPAQLSLFG